MIKEVEKGTSSPILIEQIETETLNEQAAEKKHLDASLMNLKLWSYSDNNPEKPTEYDTQTYETHIKCIKECEKLRKEFVYGKISENEFLEKITNLKWKN